VIAYFAYGTTQAGFPHHREREALLGAPVARVRTVEPYAIVVPRRAACNNPGCRYLHRMAALVPARDQHAEGDLFHVEDLTELDALELAGPYRRQTIAVVPVGGGEPVQAQAYPAVPAEPWLALADADRLQAYPREDVRLKACCEADPGHAGAHDIVEP